MKAELLARDNRFDEAIDTCHAPAFGPSPPMILRGRSAWIMAMRGDRETAIAQMRELLALDPDYYWGWQQIANWYDAAEAHGDYLEAAENLVRLSPSDPAAFGYRGEAKLFGGDRRGAKTDFQKAYELDPNYAFAGLHLMDELLADEELETAGKTLGPLAGAHRRPVRPPAGDPPGREEQRCRDGADAVPRNVPRRRGARTCC